MKKVLLVEDDLIVQRVHQMMLTKMNCHVDIAANGEDALKLQTQIKYDIIFVDIGLPDIPGFELIKKLKMMNDDNHYTIPIIALTGYAGNSEKEACLNAGAVEVVYKPIINSTLRSLLNRCNLTN